MLHDFGALGTATEASSRRTLGPLTADQRLTVWIIASIESGSLSAQLASHTSGSGGIETHRGAAVNITDSGVYRIDIDGAITDEWWAIEMDPAGGNASSEVTVVYEIV